MSHHLRLLEWNCCLHTTRSQSLREKPDATLAILVTSGMKGTVSTRFIWQWRLAHTISIFKHLIMRSVACWRIRVNKPGGAVGEEPAFWHLSTLGVWSLLMNVNEEKQGQNITRKQCYRETANPSMHLFCTFFVCCIPELSWQPRWSMWMTTQGHRLGIIL